MASQIITLTKCMSAQVFILLLNALIEGIYLGSCPGTGPDVPGPDGNPPPDLNGSIIIPPPLKLHHKNMFVYNHLT